MNNTKTAVVVIPTYNEAEVIGDMIDHLFGKVFPKIPNWQIHLLIVDDTSPDGTYKIVEKKQKQYPNLHLYLNKEKMGIGWAYVVGFRYAIKQLKADVLIEFDADFQHPPKDIPILLAKIDEGYDYVLGSRKIEGGLNPKGWGFKRVFFSEVGGLVARLVLFFPGKSFFKITDPTTGLKASRVEGFVDQIDMDNLYSYKFGYKLEFLYRMVTLGAKVAEIPLRFGLRTKGESKISSNTAKDIFRTVSLLRWHDPATQSFLKFGVVGFAGYLVNAISLAIFSRSGWAEWLAWLFSTELAIISNFTWNNLWTFVDKKFTRTIDLIKKFVQFNLTSAGALIIQTVTGTLLTSFFGPQYRQIYLPLIIVFLVLPYNWLMYNKIIWKIKKT
ncbi:MAG: glycosyltransferase [Candidatus Shapirobacteria bacterium]|nr:glycosyltransferase [Candidatus Shapirobacteria bacterium]